MTTARRIRKAMQLQGIKQVELAKATGISKGALSSYISGRYVPKQNNLSAIARCLDVSSSWLNGDDVPMERSDNFTEVDEGKVFERLIHLAHKNNISVSFVDFRAYDGRIKENRVYIRSTLSGMEEYNFNLAHELAHAYLHYDKGDIVENQEFEESADRAAKLLLDALRV